MTLEDTIRDLEGRQSANSNRPVKVELRVDSKSGAPSQVSVTHFNAKMLNSAVQLAFPDVDSAIAGLRQHVSESTAPPDTPESSAESLSEVFWSLQQILHSHLVGQSTPSVRWMWADVGLQAVLPVFQMASTNDPLQWSQWYSLEEAILDVEAFGHSGAEKQLERPVFLQIKIASPQCTLRYEERIETAAAATRILGGILDITTRLKDRSAIMMEAGPDDAEARYQEYALSTMQENGGCVGAAVRFCGPETPEIHHSIRNGQHGLIQQFDNIGNFLVNWGMHSTSVSMQQCVLLATADRRLHLAGISADDVLSELMHRAKDNLKEVSTDPAAFGQVFKRLVECCTDPGCNYRAAEVDMCNTVVEAMKRDMEQEGRPTRELQYTCCLMLWWIVHPRDGHHPGNAGQLKKSQLERKQSKAIEDAVERKEKKSADAAKDKAMEANVCEALVMAREAFPQDEELKEAAGNVVRYLIKDNAERRQKALAAGWKQRWL